jgi:Leucine-rich repeat (LRR) protein
MNKGKMEVAVAYGNRITLFHLPPSILCLIFSKWLPVHSLCFLDIAIADRNMRRVFLEDVCGSSEFEYDNNKMEIDGANAYTVVRWLDKRKIRGISQMKLEHINDEVLKYVNVQSLDICYSEITEAGLSHLNEKCSSLLQHLRIGNCDIVMDRGIRIISSFRLLSFLDIGGRSGITDEGITILSESCLMLQHLILTACNKVTDIGMEKLSLGCTMLRTLDISWLVEVTDRGMEFLSKGCINLQSLDLERCQLTDDSITFLSQNCTMLQDLTLNSNIYSEYSDKSMQELSRGKFRNTLLSLAISGCHNITDEGIFSLSLGCKKLQYLMLQECNKISDVSLKYLSSSSNVHGGCPDLQHLSLRQGFGRSSDMSHYESPANITDAGIHYLSNGCSTLQTLDLGRCTLVTDQGLHSLSRGCQLLQHLDLEHCDKVTDQGLSYLAQGCRLLKYFDCSIVYMVPLPGEEYITDKGMEELCLGCTFLEYLNISGRTKLTKKSIDVIADSSNCTMLRHLNIIGCGLDVEDIIGLIQNKKGCGVQWRKTILGECDPCQPCKFEFYFQPVYLQNQRSILSSKQKNLNAMKLDDHYIKHLVKADRLLSLINSDDDV